MFFTIVITVYGLLNSYIFIRGLQALPAGSCWRPWYSVGFWLIASTFILARVLERAYPCGFTGVITWIGSFWLAFLLYFTLAALLADLVRFLNHFIHFLPSALLADYGRSKMILLISVIGMVAMVVVAGYINARNPRIKKLNLHIAKTVTGSRELNLVMASDIHLGTLIAKRKANKLVAAINSLNPDLVLFAGDVVDEDLTPVIMNNLGANLSQIRAKLGVYAIPGNHEYIGGAEPAIRYLEEHGVKVLRDTSIRIDNRFYLVGRDDRDKQRFTGKARRELGELMKGVDHSCPVILMDHQPFHLDQTVHEKIDLQLSGHTHHGQIWPLNLITSAMYEVSSGYLKKGDTHFYVSNGFGTWGPPIRLGNRPEIVQIKLTFD
ncbi:MAG: metallophosphoesterase [Alphaproteobacteria bacterium]|nr:metallophosphoesterase [Alphaproteobacteria bacterium]